MIKTDRVIRIKTETSKLVPKYLAEYISYEEIRQAIESGEITVDEIGKMFTDYLRFAIA